MKVLLDTHAFLWYLSGDERISMRVCELARDPGTQFYLSAVSMWEIATKYHLGKLRLALSPRDFLTKARQHMRFAVMPIELAHVLRSAELEWHHRDPFDRLLIAQAQIDGLCIATADPRMNKYAVEVLW